MCVHVCSTHVFSAPGIVAFKLWDTCYSSHNTLNQVIVYFDVSLPLFTDLVLGASCDTDSTCQRFVPHSDCRLGQCLCASGYKPIGVGECVRRKWIVKQIFCTYMTAIDVAIWNSFFFLNTQTKGKVTALYNPKRFFKTLERKINAAIILTWSLFSKRAKGNAVYLKDEKDKCAIVV